MFYSNADINVGANLAMDDGVSDLIKYSWFNVTEGSVNKLFYYDNMMSPDANYRSNWDDMYEQIRRFNEYFYDVHSGFADNLDSDQLAIRTAEVRFMRAFAYQELVLRHGGVILRINEDRVDDHNQRAKARSSEEDCPNPTGRMDRIGGRPPYKGGCLWHESPCRSLCQALAGCC